MFGTVTYVNPEKRFGRIRENGSRRTYWFHRWDVDPALGFVTLLDERVDFDPRAGDKGPVAVRIRPVSWPCNE